MSSSSEGCEFFALLACGGCSFFLNGDIFSERPPAAGDAFSLLGSAGWLRAFAGASSRELKLSSRAGSGSSLAEKPSSAGSCRSLARAFGLEALAGPNPGMPCHQRLPGLSCADFSGTGFVLSDWESFLRYSPSLRVSPPSWSISQNQDNPTVTVRAKRKIAINKSVVAGRLKNRIMASETAVPSTPPEDAPRPNTE